MADESLEVQEELDFHSCNVPYGTEPFEFADLTYDQLVNLSQLRIDTVRSDEIYLAEHPQVRAIVHIILRRVLGVRPKNNIRTFIARYFQRSYEDIKAEVAEVVKSREEHICEGDSATRVPIQKHKRSEPRKVHSDKVEHAADELGPEEPEDVIGDIVDEMLLNLERVCEKDVNVIFSDYEDDIPSDFNFRGYKEGEPYSFPTDLKIPEPIGKSISEELIRLKQEEKRALHQAQQEVTHEDIADKYMELEEYAAEGGEDGPYESDMRMREQELSEEETEAHDAERRGREADAFEDTSVEEEDMDEVEAEKEKEIVEFDYDETRLPDEELEDESDTIREGEEEVEEESAPTSEVEEESVPTSEVEESPEKHSASDAEERMEEYFLAPIEDTVPTYLQADDDKQKEWTPVQPDRKVSTPMVHTILPTKGKSEHGGLRTHSSMTHGGKKESRIQVTMAQKASHEPKTAASSIMGISRTANRSKSAITTHENKSATAIRTISKEEKRADMMPKNN